MAKQTYKIDNILQQRHIILRSLLVVATPYVHVYIYIYIYIERERETYSLSGKYEVEIIGLCCRK